MTATLTTNKDAALQYWFEEGEIMTVEAYTDACDNDDNLTQGDFDRFVMEARNGYRCGHCGREDVVALDLCEPCLSDYDEARKDAAAGQ